MVRTHEYDELECLCRTCDRCNHLTADGECDMDLDIEDDEIPDELEEEIVYREYVIDWCSKTNHEFDEVIDWLESTSTYEELADKDYLEQVLDKYDEGRDE